MLNNTIGADFMCRATEAAARKCFGLTDYIAILTVGRLDSRERYKGHDRIIPLIRGIGHQGRRIILLNSGDLSDDIRRLQQSCNGSRC